MEQKIIRGYKRSYKSLIIGVFIASIVFGSCYYDIEEELYPVTEKCNVTNLSFAEDIQGIIKLHCQNCHASNFASGGVILDTYDGVKTAVLNGTLMESVRHEGTAVPMPLAPNAKIPQCAIDQLVAWIADGMKDN